MIAHLKGKILKIEPRQVILQANNIGYLVTLSENETGKLNDNEELEVFTYTHVREDALDLFGFLQYSELKFFKQLIAISGVGPKTAQDIVGLPLGKLKTSILQEDPTFISSVPKVGKKIAHRIILEMKNKIDPDDIEDLNRVHGTVNTDLNQEVVDALEKLGYNNKQIQKTLSALPKEITDPEQIIKYFLQNA